MSGPNITPTPRNLSLSDFIGRWALGRDILHEDATSARFEGEATWTPEGETLRYCETGHLILAAQRPMAAERTYIWHPGLRVCFDDGRFFHTVPPQGGATQHWCAPDQYDGNYDFSGWPEFSVSWKVRGPRKSYEMTSVYRRL